MSTPTHKSATSVTLAPLAEKSELEQLVERLWKPALLVVLLLSAWLIYRHSQTSKEIEQRDAEWSQLTAQAPVSQTGVARVPSASPATFEALSRQLAGSPVAPWAKALEANAYASQRNYDGALGALDALQAQHPSHPTVTEAWPYTNGSPSTFVAAWSEALRRQKTWEQNRQGLFANPAAPEGSPRVKITTERGEIVIELYPERAPKHVEAFLARVSDGAWKEATFSRTDLQLGVQVGEVDTQADPVPFEDSSLYHFAGAVSAADGAGAASARTAFSILTENRHDLDGQRVVFGQVASGLDVVRQIAAGEQKSDEPGTLAQPVAITSIEVLAD